MKLSEKVLIQKIIEKIEKGIFDRNDIDMLFIRLRAYSSEFSVFKEISHFVAHNEKRDRGQITEGIKMFYYTFLFLYNYEMMNKKLDIKDSIPGYLKKVIINEIKKCDKFKLRQYFNVTKDTLINRIENIFIGNHEDGIIYPKRPLSNDTYNAIIFLLRNIKIKPLFTEGQILDSMMEVLKNNDISYNSEKILIQKDKIIMCILILIHHTNFDIGINKKIFCHIYYDTYSKTLTLIGSFTFPDYDEFYMGCEIIKTSLLIGKFCGNEMFEKEHRRNMEKDYSKGSVFNSELDLNENFQLIEIIP
jgi:hypothetical protein